MKRGGKVRVYRKMSSGCTAPRGNHHSPATMSSCHLRGERWHRELGGAWRGLNYNSRTEVTPGFFCDLGIPSGQDG